MPTQTSTKNGKVETGAAIFERDDEQALRDIAVEQLERVRKFKMHLLTWAVGVPVLGFIWMMTEYFQDNRWPSRFADADNGVPSTWNPWFFWAAGIWTAVLLLHAVRTYAGARLHPPTKADVDREVDRLKSQG